MSFRWDTRRARRKSWLRGSRGPERCEGEVSNVRLRAVPLGQGHPPVQQTQTLPAVPGLGATVQDASTFLDIDVDHLPGQTLSHRWPGTGFWCLWVDEPQRRAELPWRRLNAGGRRPWPVPKTCSPAVYDRPACGLPAPIPPTPGTAVTSALRARTETLNRSAAGAKAPHQPRRSLPAAPPTGRKRVTPAQEDLLCCVRFPQTQTPGGPHTGSNQSTCHQPVRRVQLAPKLRRFDGIPGYRTEICLSTLGNLSVNLDIFKLGESS